MERSPEAFGEAFRMRLREAGAATGLLRSLPTEVSDGDAVALAKQMINVAEPSMLFKKLHALEVRDPLAWSVEALVISEVWAQLFSARDIGLARRRLDQYGYPWLDLPKLVAPQATGGYMSLTQAAQWIATEGGKRDFSASDRESWKRPFAELFDALAAGHLQIVGTRAENSQCEVISPLKFTSCGVAFPYGEPERGWLEMNSPYVWAFTDDCQLSSDEFTDRYCQGTQVIWSELQVPQPRVRDLWQLWRPAGKMRGRKHDGMQQVRRQLERYPLAELHRGSQLYLGRQILRDIETEFAAAGTKVPNLNTIVREIRAVRSRRPLVE